MSRIHSFRCIYSSFVSASGLAAVQRWRLRRGVAIVTYHDIASAVFSRHLEFFSHNYRIVSLAQVAAWLRGEADVPSRSLVITFDDGFRSVYSEVYPELQRFCATATVFLTTGYPGSQDILWFSWLDLAFSSGAQFEDLLPTLLRGLERSELRRRLMPYLKAAPDRERLALVAQIKQRLAVTGDDIARYHLMTWDQAREMAKSGLVSFGGHTRTHPILARTSPDKARAEINGCAADLERELGPGQRCFAYPNGEASDFNAEIEDLVRGAGFACAASARRGVCGRGDDLFALPRIAVDGSFSVAEVATKLSGLWVHLGRGDM